MTIAGHTFVETGTGRRCMNHNNQGVVCYRSWLSIKDTVQEQCGKPNIAHNGDLNASEFNDIVAERQREIDAMWKAVSDASSSGSR